jgi:CDP-L-myo-inositol myo-inositolphosphotransferase
MCDHLFEPDILKLLVAADDGKEGCLLAVDRRLADIFDLEDATLVRLDGETITAIEKGLENPDAVDTGIFLCRPALFEALKEARREGDGSLSGGIRQLIEDGGARAVETDGHFWLDVDTPEALDAGEERLLGKLKTAKRIDGPVSRYINRFFSLKLTRRLAPYPVTPNQVSLASCALGFLGAACFFAVGLVAAGHPWLAWLLAALGGLIIQASSILDGVDGEIARLKHQVSPYGAYFDYILDRYVDGLAVTGMVYSSFVLSGDFSIILIGCVALIGLPLSSIHRAKFLAEAKRNYLAEDDGLLRYIPCSRDVRMFVIFLGGVLNQLRLAIYLLAIVPNLVALLRLYTAKKALE